jgi:hypothetical protein
MPCKILYSYIISLICTYSMWPQDWWDKPKQGHWLVTICVSLWVWSHQPWTPPYTDVVITFSYIYPLGYQFFLNSTVHNGTIQFTESFVYTMECIVLGSCYYSTLLVLQSTQIVMKNDVSYILLKYELFLYKTSNRLHPLICSHLRCVFSHVINSY